jgi:hypothetical protein
VKTCSQCKEVKPLESFTRQKAGKDGYRPSCRACCQAYNAEYRKKNAVKVKAYNDRWRAENRERHNAYGRQWSKDNRERAGENRRKWRKNNPEKVRAAKKRYREKNPEKHRALRKREYEKNSETYKARVRQWVKDKPEMRRAQILKRRGLAKNAAGTDYTTAQHIAWRVELYGGCCYYCGQPADTIDHRISLVNGGTHWPANLVPCCRSCNSSKNKRNELEYRAAA